MLARTVEQRWQGMDTGLRRLSCNKSKSSEAEDERDSSTDIVKTPSQGTLQRLQRVKQGLDPMKGKLEVNTSCAVVGESSRMCFPCCYAL